MITIVAPFYTYFSKKVKELKKRNKMTGSKKKMLFWKRETVGSNLIALDITKRNLLYFNKVNNKPACVIINLKDIHSCTIKKQYHGINAGGLMKQKLQDYLKNILLYLCFNNGSRSIALPFYEEQDNRKEDAERLEIKAKEWETTISKLLNRQVAERA
ncbi:hypothetical protein FC093_07815 [Ilyomonas limi]|uniref:Uncharacterized protein n=1 Tax=Ilyomonas limi TaxID=2575867 RepID=A0A4U3L4G3_9BACT|nr:hypothetical protein [Ilyomonas limi]TKK69214.1 hypothetical protein FC093_07815 [Ilyomonas limi]